MHLSVAVLKGHDMKSSNARVFLRWVDGQYEGCALGGAALATGIRLAKRGADQPDVVVKHLRETFPWLSEARMIRLCDLYREVHIGSLSLEEYVLYINRIEPACGDCNRFKCTCADDEAGEDYPEDEDDEYEEVEEYAART